MTPDHWVMRAVEKIVAELAAVGFKRGEHAVNFTAIIWGEFDEASRCDTCGGSGRSRDDDGLMCLECNGKGRTLPENFE